MPVLRVLLLAALATLTACGDADSPEQQVRQVIDKMETAAEARDVSELTQHLSSEYRDAAGNWDLAANLYEFKLSLRREDGEWKVSFAQWTKR